MRILTAALAVAVIASPALAQQVEPEIFTLPNGMKFLLVERHDQPNTIAAGWLAKVGSVNERPGITGISHFFEHMMFKGTDTIGTRDPQRDAGYRERQKRLRNRINELTWTVQYERFKQGEIADPWDPKNDTTELAALRTDLRRLMDEQQGKAGEDVIKRLEADLSKVDASTPEGKQRADAMRQELAAVKAGQAKMATIVKDEFDQVYSKAGGTGMNAFTSYDLTFYFINVPSNKMELWCWMESDRLTDSVFREFFSERDVVHEERRLRTDSTPTGRFQEQFDSMFWASCGYAWPVIGWPSDLNSYTTEQADEYWNTFYRPGNLFGIIVGDFDPKQARTLIERYFSRLDAGTRKPPPVVTLEVDQLAEQRMNAEGDFPPSIEVRYHTVPAGHADSYPLDVLAEILNERTGRLYAGLVEGRGIAATARASSDTRKYAGLFSFEAQTRGDATPEKLEQAWYEELAAIQKTEIPERELRKVKNRIAAGNYRRLENNMSLLIQLAFAEALLDWREINEGPRKYEAVTAADIRRVANEYFKPTNRSVAIYRREQKASR
ncbi:MAG: M16 family metallopeptidase [Phycisphaerales bacterium]